jgi:hypothetical protein
MDELTPAAKVILELDLEAARAVIASLDLYQRVAIGQWREIVDACPAVLGEGVNARELGDALMSLRSRWTAVEALCHPDAYLRIRTAHRRARVAYDVWQRMTETTERQAMPITGAHVTVTKPRYQITGLKCQRKTYQR